MYLTVLGCSTTDRRGLQSLTVTTDASSQRHLVPTLGVASHVAANVRSIERVCELREVVITGVNGRYTPPHERRMFCTEPIPI